MILKSNYNVRKGAPILNINTNILKCSFFSSGEQEAGIVISEGAAVCTDLLKKTKDSWTISPNTFLEKRIQLQGLKIFFKIKPYI